METFTQNNFVNLRFLSVILRIFALKNVKNMDRYVPKDVHDNSIYNRKKKKKKNLKCPAIGNGQ